MNYKLDGVRVATNESFLLHFNRKNVYILKKNITQKVHVSNLAGSSFFQTFPLTLLKGFYFYVIFSNKLGKYQSKKGYPHFALYTL